MVRPGGPCHLDENHGEPLIYLGVSGDNTDAEMPINSLQET